MYSRPAWPSAKTLARQFERIAFTSEFGGQYRAGRLTALVDSVFDISQGRKAFERLASGQQFGKVVVRIPE